MPAGFEPRLDCGGISLPLNLPTWSESSPKPKEKAGCSNFKLHLLAFVVRPAGFEPAAYGFEVRFRIKKQIDNGNKK